MNFYQKMQQHLLDWRCGISSSKATLHILTKASLPVLMILILFFYPIYYLTIQTHKINALHRKISIAEAQLVHHRILFQKIDFLKKNRSHQYALLLHKIPTPEIVQHIIKISSQESATLISLVPDTDNNDDIQNRNSISLRAEWKGRAKPLLKILSHLEAIGLNTQLLSWSLNDTETYKTLKCHVSIDY